MQLIRPRDVPQQNPSQILYQPLVLAGAVVRAAVPVFDSKESCPAKSAKFLSMLAKGLGPQQSGISLMTVSAHF